MTKEINLVPLEEFTHNPAGFFEEVLRESKPIVVENEKGERALLKPLGRRKTKARAGGKGQVKTEAERTAFLASAGSWSDVDIEAFLKANEESRRLSRPPVEL